MAVIFSGVTKSLKTLIDAGSSAPWAAGESFLNHVNDSDAGDKMTDYRLTNWSWSGAPVLDSESPYSDQHAFSMTCSMTQGSHAQYIKRTGAVLVVTPSTQAGYAVTLSGHSVAAASTGTTLTVTVTAPYSSNATPSGHTWWAAYNGPRDSGTDTQPGGNGQESVRFTGYLDNASGSGSEEVAFTIDYLIDAGGFNGTVTETFQFYMNRRAETENDWDWEWHGNSSYTNLLSSNRSYVPGTTGPGESLGPYWLRAKRKTTSSWTNVSGSVSWTDPRELV